LQDANDAPKTKTGGLRRPVFFHGKYLASPRSASRPRKKKGSRRAQRHSEIIF
jgi:hypothetical protein